MRHYRPPGQFPSIAVRPSNKPIKKIEPNERLAAQTLKGKAMDALKISGQKPQIKLTLKPPETKREKPALGLVAGKKRPSDDTPPAETKVCVLEMLDQLVLLAFTVSQATWPALYYLLPLNSGTGTW